MKKETKQACQNLCLKSFNPEDQFLTTDRNKKWFKISVWSPSPFRCDLRPTQYGSGVKIWTNVESAHQKIENSKNKKIKFWYQF